MVEFIIGLLLGITLGAWVWIAVAIIKLENHRGRK